MAVGDSNIVKKEGARKRFETQRQIKKVDCCRKNHDTRKKLKQDRRSSDVNDKI